MKVKMSIKDFQLAGIQQLAFKGGQTDEHFPTKSECTAGDNGCCDSSHNDDTIIEIDGYWFYI